MAELVHARAEAEAALDEMEEKIESDIKQTLQREPEQYNLHYKTKGKMITNKDELIVITSAAILDSFKIMANTNKDLSAGEMRDIIVDLVTGAILERGICILELEKRKIENCKACRYKLPK